MKKNPAVSVIVPLYKVERYVKQCVDSILAQTFTDFEIILVDDASPDACAELCQKLYGDNPKVKLVRHEKNLGLGAARNTGMKHALGKYICFVDSDDFILPAALEKFYAAAEKNNAEVVHSAGWYVLAQEEVSPVRKENLQGLWSKYNQEGFLQPNAAYRLEEYWRKLGTWAMAWLRFCRRDFLTKNKIEFLPIISEDETFSIALFCLAKRYYVLHDTLYVYRKHSGSIMDTKSAEQFSKSIQSIATGAAYLKKFLNRLPRFENDEQWRKGMLAEFFNRFVNNHTLPYYNNLPLQPEMTAAVEQTLKKIFGNDADFVSYFFNGWHSLMQQTTTLLQQRKTLAAENQRLKNFATTLVSAQPALLRLAESIKSADKRIFLMGTPQHGNLGDQAIVLGELRILQEYFPDHAIIEIPYDYLTGELGKILNALGFVKQIRQDDVIFLHGGGNLGNLWLNEENLRRALIKKFAGNKLVVFPQSIYFSADAAGRKELATAQQIYNAHKDLHLMTRDENSFSLAQKIFPQVHNYLLPDAATALLGILDDVDVAREGVLFVLRGDKEKVRDDNEIQRLQKYLAEQNIPFEVTDTAIDGKVTADTREEKIRDVLMKIRKSKLVVTDRFHGVIFSFITRTPALAFKSFDTKISSGIKWFKNLPTIFYAEGQDWAACEDFIDENYFAAEEDSFATLNVKVTTDSKERFFRALDKIFAEETQAADVPALPESVADEKSNRLTLDDVNIAERRIVFKYSVQGDWQKYFNKDAEFFIEYSEDISAAPKDIAVIPFLCTVLPIAWVSDAEVVVEALDYDFYNHLEEIKRACADMYPKVKFGGKLTVKNVVRHDYAASDETAVFFSGDTDSFYSLTAHAEEHPTLITLLGANVNLDDKGLNSVSRHALKTAQQFKCKNLFITSTFRDCLKTADDWRHGTGIIGHAAPYAYLHKLKAIYTTTDNPVRLGKCVTIHDGGEVSGQDKIRRLCEFKRRTGTPIKLRVCRKFAGERNCCACEECYRTICGILAEGENPAEYGFPSYSSNVLRRMRRDFQKPDFKYRQLTWQIIQARFHEQPENLAKAKYLDWLMEMEF